jgi:tRNA(Ile)-lysidine synthase
VFDLPAWRGLPLGLQRATLREAIHRLRASLRNINWEHVEAAVWLAREGSTGQAATLAAGLELRIGYRSLRIAAEGAAWRPDVPQVKGEAPLAVPGVTKLDDGWRVEVLRGRREALPVDFNASADPWAAILDAAAIGAELLLRPRQPGDRFQPQGLGGHSVKLNEFMINAQVPRDARAGWPLLVGAGGIAWVCGLRIAERTIVRSATEEVWQVRIVRGDS